MLVLTLCETENFLKNCIVGNRTGMDCEDRNQLQKQWHTLRCVSYRLESMSFCGDLNFFIICLVLITTVLLLVRPYCLCYVVVCLVMI